MISRSRAKVLLQYGNMAGVPYSHAVALRQLGRRSFNVIPDAADPVGTDLRSFNRQLPYDRALSSESAPWLLRMLSRGRFFLRALGECNLIHLYGTTILPKQLDLPLLRAWGMPMIVSWAGGDGRIIEWARKKNPYFYREKDPKHDDEVRRRLERMGHLVRYAATDPELAEYSRPFFERVFILQQPIDLSNWTPRFPRADAECPKVLHIPTHREVKGTRFIEAAVEQLQSEGMRFELRLLSPNLTQRQVREEIADADVYVDQLRCGSYGMTSIEAMACGKPTITYIRGDLWDQYPQGLPIVNASPDTITDRLRELVGDGAMRRELGEKSRRFVEDYHALEVVGPALLKVYREIGVNC